MSELFNQISLFLPQILVGSLLGILLSALGVILILRNMAFFGITLSQVATFAVAVSLFFGLKGEAHPIWFSLVIFLPVFYLAKSSRSKIDSVLGILFVSFGALSQILISLGGNVQNHLLSAYFGDILTSEVKFRSYMFFIIILNIFLFIIFYRKILFQSFDKDEYSVQKLSPYIEILFFGIVTSTLSLSVNLLGSFYSAAQLIIPAFTALYLFRSMQACLWAAGLMSGLATILGFFLSLLGISFRGETIYFPTSSLIVVTLSVFAASFIGMRKLYILFLKQKHRRSITEG